MSEKQMVTQSSTSDLTEERTYYMPPHPQAAAPLSMKSTDANVPITAEKTVSELIHQAVNGLQFEMKAEIESQIRNIQADLHAELKTELQKELKGDWN